MADKVFDIHSLWITSCDYGVFTLPEKKDAKTHVEALHDDLAKLPGDPWHNHQVTITHYAAYINAKRGLKASVYGSSPGLIPAVMAGMGEKCSQTDMHGGWYTATEITNARPPIVIEINAIVDGKPLTLRSVYSPDTDVIPKLKRPSDYAELAAAVQKADLAFAASFSAETSPTAPLTPTNEIKDSSTPLATSLQVANDDGLTSQAQQVATHLGCGGVHPTGNATFAAECSGFGVAIDCNGGQCRPIHTINNQ